MSARKYLKIFTNLYLYMRYTLLNTIGSMSVVISVRIRREIKEILEQNNVNISEEIRRFLEELAWKIKIRKFVEEWDKILTEVRSSEEGFSVRSVGEDRGGH